MPPLVALLGSSSEAQGYAAAALANLAQHVPARRAIVEAGGVAPLAELSRGQETWLTAQASRILELIDADGSAASVGPHWGKMHWSNASVLRAAYGDEAWDSFAEQRAAMDPTGVFLNDFLRAQLGL